MLMAGYKNRTETNLGPGNKALGTELRWIGDLACHFQLRSRGSDRDPRVYLNCTSLTFAPGGAVEYAVCSDSP